MVERHDPAHGRVVIKVFVVGTLAEAEREFAMGRLVAGPGVVPHLAVGIDAASNRPFVSTQRLPGVDLDRLVMERGALAATTACTLLASVAATLARMHGLRLPGAPAGLCHGDVKPKNLLADGTVTTLLDFEHAQPITRGQTGFVAALGTVGFRAPEAAAGAPTAAIDVYGLGATLAWLLSGGGAAKIAPHAALQALIAACCHANPTQRPAAANVAAQLAQLASTLQNDQGELVLADWTSAAFARKPSTLDDGPGERVWRQRRRLLAKRPQLLTRPTAVPDEPTAVLTALMHVASALRRFPRHAELLRWRADLLHATTLLLAAAAQHTAAQSKLEMFTAATDWLAALDRAVRLAIAMPGGLPMVPVDASGQVGLSQREPLAFLQRLKVQVATAHAELRDDVERINAAEQRLDCRAAEAAIEQMAARHGGASPTAARHRDRLHRLSFYLDRVARADTNVERMAPLWDSTALHPLTTIVKAATLAKVRAPRGDVQASAVGLRSLQLTLTNVVDEFPHLPQIAAALDVLALALAHVTDQAWQLLADARQGLAAVPVPVRPLQLTLGRLDTFRILEAFLDRPERPRSQLLDGIESLRLSLEQARSTRDRLAESAEHALARGHWTTGLFDMERAVAGLSPGDEREREEATRLQDRLEQARRRKQEVEASVRRNVDLATLYGTLQDDPASTFVGRLQVLEERRDCLLFLVMHVPAERTVLYHRDLRDIDTEIALERAGLAEHQLDGTVDPMERLRLAHATIEQLSASLTQGDQTFDPPGRVVRLIEHWRTVTAHCQRAVDAQHAALVARARQRTRLLAILVAAILVTTTAIAFAIRPWLGTPAMAGEKDTPPPNGK